MKELEREDEAPEPREPLARVLEGCARESLASPHVEPRLGHKPKTAWIFSQIDKEMKSAKKTARRGGRRSGSGRAGAPAWFFARARGAGTHTARWPSNGPATARRRALGGGGDGPRFFHNSGVAKAVDNDRVAAVAPMLTKRRTRSSRSRA